MSATSDSQRRAFDFLLEKYHSQELFTTEEFQKESGWTAGTLKTYLSKQFRDLLIPVDDSFRVHGVFGQYATWAKFRDNVVTQNRRLVKDYEPLSFKSVIIFEFFMPLRNEEYLRTALDALFFRDSVMTRLKAIDETLLIRQFPRSSGELKEKHYERLCAWIGDKFVGYSILHVHGRFRVGELKTHQEVASAQGWSAERYLVDETTAVVRFIIPCGAVAPSQFATSKQTTEQLELKAGSVVAAGDHREEDLVHEANLIRWFFMQLFVQRVIEVIAGEDEVWLLESGLQSQLHIWRGRN